MEVPWPKLIARLQEWGRRLSILTGFGAAPRPEGRFHEVLSDSPWTNAGSLNIDEQRTASPMSGERARGPAALMREDT